MNKIQLLKQLSLAAVTISISTGCTIVHPTIPTAKITKTWAASASTSTDTPSNPEDSETPTPSDQADQKFESAEKAAREVQAILQKRINDHRTFDFTTGVLTLGATAGAGALGGFDAHRDVVVGTLVGAGTVNAARTFVPFDERIKIINEGISAIECSIMATRNLHQQAEPTKEQDGKKPITDGSNPSPKEPESLRKLKEACAADIPPLSASLKVHEAITKLNLDANAGQISEYKQLEAEINGFNSVREQVIKNFRLEIQKSAAEASAKTQQAKDLTKEAKQAFQKACNEAPKTLRAAVYVAVAQVNEGLNGLGFKADAATEAAKNAIQTAISGAEQSADKAKKDLEDADQNLKQSESTAAAGAELDGDVAQKTLKNDVAENQRIEDAKTSLDSLIQKLNTVKHCFDHGKDK